jgi:hypothetical protein
MRASAARPARQRGGRLQEQQRRIDQFEQAMAMVPRVSA